MKHEVTGFMRQALAEQADLLCMADDAQIDAVVDMIAAAPRVFAAGAGRSGNVARCFAMRLMHMGLETYVVGETVTPAIRESDVLLISSGSGETGALLNYASRAKRFGAKVALITIFPDSSIGKTADAVIRLPGVTFKSDAAPTTKSSQPHGVLYEHMSFLLFDCMILALMDARGFDKERLFDRHANLE
jgi:6-phospho-3-hexuloisomerase